MKSVFVPTSAVLAALAGAPRVDYQRFRKDLDRLFDYEPPQDIPGDGSASEQGPVAKEDTLTKTGFDR